MPSWKRDWTCTGSAKVAWMGVDAELLKLMYRAGCRVIAYGVESGNRDTLALLRKDVEVEQVVQAFSATREAKLRSLAYLILGAPGESSSDVRRSIRFVRELGADYVQFSALTALPGTPLLRPMRTEPLCLYAHLWIRSLRRKRSLICLPKNWRR